MSHESPWCGGKVPSNCGHLSNVSCTACLLKKGGWRPAQEKRAITFFEELRDEGLRFVKLSYIFEWLFRNYLRGWSTNDIRVSFVVSWDPWASVLFSLCVGVLREEFRSVFVDLRLLSGTKLIGTYVVWWVNYGVSKVNLFLWVECVFKVVLTNRFWRHTFKAQKQIGFVSCFIFCFICSIRAYCQQ